MLRRHVCGWFAGNLGTSAPVRYRPRCRRPEASQARGGTGGRSCTEETMPRIPFRVLLGAAAAVAAAAAAVVTLVSLPVLHAQANRELERGKYLVIFGGC